MDPRLIAIPAILVAFAIATTSASAQSPPPSALINQGAQETVEAAREASPRDSAETFQYFEDEVDAALADAIERVWDPERPRQPSPRTAWGDPDLSGYWLSVSYTPLERPDALGDKALYSTEEAIEAFQRSVTRDAGVDPATVHYDWTEFGMDMWQSPVRPNRRTALIVDPPDGKMPARTAEGRARFQENARRHTLESRALTERCIVGSEGPPRVPFVQNIHESQIVQTPDYVVLLAQSNSDVRIIPIDGRPHPPATVRSYLGESRGHWEGDTLVVETTNFHPDRKWVRPQEMDGDLHLVERLTRIDEDTVLYEATMTDPTTWEAPWTIEIPWPKMEPPGLFEFACHEQNYGLINVLTGARVRAAEFEATQESDD